MKVFYCAKTRGFYSEDFHGKDATKNLVEVDFNKYKDLHEKQAEGFIIAPDKKGRPCLTAKLPLTEKESSLEILKTRDSLVAEVSLKILSLQDMVDLKIADEHQTNELVEWKTYRIELCRVENQPNFPCSVSWPIPPGDLGKSV